MRKIIFRGKRKSNGLWVYGSLNQHDIHHGTSILTNGVINNAVTEESVGQFTGLLDKNEKQIYEGDRLYHYKNDGTVLNSFTATVVFKESKAAFGYIEDGFTRIDYFASFDELQEDFLSHCEVIGNIHDGKEVQQ